MSNQEETHPGTGSRPHRRVSYMSAAALAALMLSSCVGGPPAAPAPSSETPIGAASGVTRSPAPTESPGRDDEGGDLDYTPGPSQPAPAPARALAERFGRLWTRRQVNADVWWQDLRSLCTPALHEKLRGTDPASVPADEITGPPEPVFSRRGEAAFHLAAGRAGTLILGTADVPGHGWRVATVDFRRSA
jgi:hypothetical protein